MKKNTNFCIDARNENKNYNERCIFKFFFQPNTKNRVGLVFRELWSTNNIIKLGQKV